MNVSTFFNEVASRWDRRWLSALLVVLAGFVVAVWLLWFAIESPAANTFVRRLNDCVSVVAGLQPLSPLVVTVYERTNHARRNHLTTDLRSTDRGVIIDLSYNERLVVVKPYNWLIYTNNGLNFYLITNNVSNRTAQCDLDRQMIAIDFRLQSVRESDRQKDESGRFKIACLNYTLDGMIRLFGLQANRTYVDLTKHFDRRANPSAPPVVADEIVNYLLLHRLL